MKGIRPISIKKASKVQRERQVLLRLVELYLRTGKPVGSNTLREVGFKDVSSATIRNYFSRLEQGGFLLQQHTSGGRIPTAKAYQDFAEEYVDFKQLQVEDAERLDSLGRDGIREVSQFLQEAAEVLSDMTGLAVLLSAPRFDQDFVKEIKVLPLEPGRCLFALLTDFGSVHTEVLSVSERFSLFMVGRVEAYFRWKITGQDEPESLSEVEKVFSERLYKELMVRFIVGYANHSREDIHRCGFSRLLAYPEFEEPGMLASGLALFEDLEGMSNLLGQCRQNQDLMFLIGDDLKVVCPENENCSVLAVPYRIHQSTVGAIGILGPMRIPYPRLFAILRAFSEVLSQTLTRSVYKYKLTYREPEEGGVFLPKDEILLLESRLPESDNEK